MGSHFIKLKKEQDALFQSSFKNMPIEIILHIFEFLSISDLCNISLVCRSFKMIVDHDDIWKPKCNTSLKPHSTSYKQIYMKWMQEKSIRNQELKQFERSHEYRTACIVCQLPLYPVRPSNEYEFESTTSSFSQHPNSTQEMTIHLSVDIDKIAPQLISLLEKASCFQQQWRQPAILKQMIQRYYRFMQLKASHLSNILLIPTLDIEIIWQTHLLRPEIYRNDCLRLFRRIIDHSLIMKNDIEQLYKEQAFLDTCQLYQQKFGEDYCELPSNKKKKKFTSKRWYRAYESLDDNRPNYFYWDETYFEFSSDSPNDYENPFSFTEGDVILDGKWLDLCKQFMFMAVKKVPIRGSYMYGPNEIDLELGALKRLKKSYERFLYMAAKYSLKDGNGFIPPTYAIDIIWHSHMQEPLNYEADCMRLVGYVIYHDPWPMVEDEKMNNSCDRIDTIWKNEFQCNIETDHLYHTLHNGDFWFDED